MKGFLNIYFLIIILILLLGGFVFGQNLKTVFKTDNRMYRFVYKFQEDYKQRFEFGKSNYSDSWDKPLINFMPASIPLLATNSNIFSVLLDGTTTRIISTRLRDNRREHNQLTNIYPHLGKVSFTDDGNVSFSLLYADIGKLIAIYGCNEDFIIISDNGCLGKTTVYRDGAVPEGAIRTRDFGSGIGWYRNPQYCFSDTLSDLGTAIHICTGDCSDDDEGLTICFRKKFD